MPCPIRLLGGDDPRVRIAEKSSNSRHSARWCAPSSNNGDRAFVEHAAQRPNPAARRPERERVGARGVGRYHPTDRAKVATRWIDGETETVRRCCLLHFRAECAWLD